MTEPESDSPTARSGFERYNQSLAGLRTWKGTVLTDDRRSHLTDYRDVGEMVGDD